MVQWQPDRDQLNMTVFFFLSPPPTRLQYRALSGPDWARSGLGWSQAWGWGWGWQDRSFSDQIFHLPAAHKKGDMSGVEVIWKLIKISVIEWME